MSLKITKYPIVKPNRQESDSFAEVEPLRRTGLVRLAAPRTGLVIPFVGGDKTNPWIRVIPPVWKGGQKGEWESLARCYRKILRLARKHRWNAVQLPLLTEQQSEFPVGIDFKVAVNTIRECLEQYDLDVYLIVPQQNPLRRLKVERFLSSHMPGEDFSKTSYPVVEEAPWFDEPMSQTRMSAGAMVPEDYQMEWAPCSSASVCEEEEKTVPKPSRSRASGTMLPPMPAPSAQRSCSRTQVPDLSELMRKLDAGFSETLLRLIDQSGKKDSEVYNKANVSRQHFSKIRNNPNYKPTKPTAIAFAIALELNMDQTLDLIGRAGYTLTTSSRFDVIIMYFIEQRNYNMFDINETLFEFDQSLLGA